MALQDSVWYVNWGNGSTTGFFALPKWATSGVHAAGDIVRQKTAPAYNNNRAFICIVAGTSDGVTEPTWGLTRGAITAEASGTVQWQECTGIAGLNGDLSSTPNWTEVKNTAVTLGQVIQRNSAGSLQICTVAGNASNGAEPAFSNTAGVTTSDGTVTWTSLGAPGNFAGGGVPHASMQAAMAAGWGQAGNDFYVDKNSQETESTATMTLTSPGTAALPCRVLCVDFSAGAFPPTAVTTGATISTTSTRSMTFAGYVSRCDGVAFSIGSGSSASSWNLGTAAACMWQFYNGGITIASTAATSTIVLGASLGSEITIRLYNWVMKFGAVGQQIVPAQGKMWWEGGSINAAGSAPTTLIKNGAARPCNLEFRGVDLSFLGSGKTIIDAQTTDFKFKAVNCKINAAVTLANTPTLVGTDFEFINCDAAGINRFSRFDFQGSQQWEGTIVRTGGASDGATPFSWNITPNANAEKQLPFISEPIAVWCDAAGSPKTVTIYGIWVGAAVPHNDDIWPELEYPGDSGSPLAAFLSGGLTTPLSAHSAWSADGSVWGGASSPARSPFTMALTFTPLQRGYAYIRLYAATLSTAFYIDPKPVLS